MLARSVLTAVCAALLSPPMPSTAAAAQAYPAKPIRLVVTFPPGGGTDVLARTLGQELHPVLGQPVIADNKPGATGNIGADIVAKSAPDGYTLLIVNSSFAINAGVFEKLPFDTLKDFTPIVLFASVPSFVAVTPSLGVRNLQELIALAKAKPGKLSYASCGPGSPQHLAAEMLKSMTGTDIAHIPYKGCAPALADVAGGHVPISFNTAANTVPHLKSGKLVAIATTGKKRFPLAPEVPTVEEGGLPDYDLEQWYGILGPAKLPRDVVDRLNAAVIGVVSSKPLQEKLLAQGWATTTSTPAAFAKVIRDDVARYGKLSRSLGLKAD